MLMYLISFVWYNHLNFRQSQESEQSCICVLGLPILPFSTILIFDFRIVPIVWYFLFFLFYSWLILQFIYDSTMEKFPFLCFLIALRRVLKSDIAYLRQIIFNFRTKIRYTFWTSLILWRINMMTYLKKIFKIFNF
jgi:hypothetical protein